MTFLKTRALPAGERSFSAQAERAKTAARKSSFQSVTGMYDSFYARQKALWFAICPDQKWNSEVYDREKQEVVTQTDSFFLANVEHRVAVNKRRFVCSATAHKTMPCWGCGIRSHFYDRQRQIQEDTGIRPKNEAPLSAMQQYAVAGVLLEQMTKIEAKNPDGTTRYNRDRTKKIMNDTPIALLEPGEQKKARSDGNLTFGKSVFYNMGITTLNAFVAFDRELRNVCASCCSDLIAEKMCCPECAEEYDIHPDGAIGGEDLLNMRDADYQCTACEFFGQMIPLVLCTNEGCDNPTEGKLLDFALRIKVEKVGDTANVLKYTEVKLLKDFIEKYPLVDEMLKKPLELDKIFAPSNLEFQKTLIPENLRGDGVSPNARRSGTAGPMATGYPLNGGDGDEG
jgi:hypothetical protein